MNKTLDNIPVAIPIYQTENTTPIYQTENTTPIYQTENTPLINKTVNCHKCKSPFYLTTSYSSKENVYHYCDKCQINRCRTCQKTFYLTPTISPYTAAYYRCENCLLFSPKSIINSCLIS